jgi:hypothetical protein
MQGDGWKAWKNTKPRSGLSCCGGLDFMKSRNDAFAYKMKRGGLWEPFIEHVMLEHWWKKLSLTY